LSLAHERDADTSASSCQSLAIAWVILDAV
jgi:hypothetical protein